MRSDALVRRFNLPRASHDNLVLFQDISLLFRQKSSECRFLCYLFQNAQSVAILQKCFSLAVVIIDWLLKYQFASFSLKLVQNIINKALVGSDSQLYNGLIQEDELEQHNFTIEDDNLKLGSITTGI